MEAIDKNRSLRELENAVDDGSFPPRAYELYHAPLREFSDDDVRYMLNLGYGLKFMIPIALDILTENPLVGVSFYDGDLLSAVLNPPAEFWKENPELWSKTEEIVSAAEYIVQDFKLHIMPKVGHFLNVKPEEIK